MAAHTRKNDAGQGVWYGAPIQTWFGVGGGADKLVQPASIDGLRAAIAAETGRVRVLGDGANLLVADEGVGGMVVSLKQMRAVRWSDDGAVVAQAGTRLPRLINEAVRRGFGGVEGLAGVPATIGGAARMNAGGAHAQVADVVERVLGVDLVGGGDVVFEKEALGFGYRESNLAETVVTEVHLRLVPGQNEGTLRDRVLRVMEAKKTSQPLAQRSAGCVFRNPDVRGKRVSAGALIDQAGCKGKRVGCASVSERHGNFIVVQRQVPGASAADVLALIELVRERVRATHGVELEREVVVWDRGKGE